MSSFLTVPGIDFAWGSPPYRDAQRAGIKFVMRYISHDPGKDLTKAEAEEWQRLGIKVGVVFETTAKRALAGYNAGVEDARYASARCVALGIRPAIYFAVDFDETDADKPATARYLRGAASVLGYARTGVYGGYWVVKYMAENKVCAWFWQTFAWSGHNVHPATHIYQYRNGVSFGGTSCDLNHARAVGSYGTAPVPVVKPPKTVTRAARRRQLWSQRLGVAQRQVVALSLRIKKLKQLVNRRKDAQAPR